MKQFLLKIKLFKKSFIGQFTKKLNGRNVHAFIAKTDNGMYAVDPEDLGVGKQLRTEGSYGGDEIDRLRAHINPKSRVLFVGAHIGTLAIPVAALCKEVVAIEANPDTFKLLSTNIALNSVSNCRAINIAANNKEESIKFLLSRDNSGGSKRVPHNKEFMYYYDNPKEISVKGFSLDEYLDDNAFDVVVMDIEGSEYFALQGMQKMLKKTKLLVIEFLPHHLRNVSGVSIEEFLSVIPSHFSKLTIPVKGKTVEVSEFYDNLSEMYEKDEEEPGLMFMKA